MNENQKKVLIAAGIGLVIWSGYRLYIKRPIPPMRPVKVADAVGDTNFTGYSDMTGRNSSTITNAQKVEVALANVNKMLEYQGRLTTSQINKLNAVKKKLLEMQQSYGGDEQSNGYLQKDLPSAHTVVHGPRENPCKSIKNNRYVKKPALQRISV